MDTDRHPLFLWRGHTTETLQDVDGDPDNYAASGIPIDLRGEWIGVKCPHCGGEYSSKSNDYFQTGLAFGHCVQWTGHCIRCGFWYDHSESDPLMTPGDLDHTVTVALLREFDLNDEEVALDELGSHLKRRYADVYALAPRRFELLVADVFSQHGYSVRVTKQARDGGYDLHLLEQSSGKQCLVECKRYRRHRRVHIGLVRQLRGVQLDANVREAKLVTSSYFTGPARGLEAQVADGESGFSLELIDADELTRMLSVYNSALPPLPTVWPRG